MSETPRLYGFNGDAGGTVTIEGVTWVTPDTALHRICTAVPCSHCGGCSACGDFHGNAYGGCTAETCPLLNRSADATDHLRP